MKFKKDYNNKKNEFKNEFCTNNHLWFLMLSLGGTFFPGQLLKRKNYVTYYVINFTLNCFILFFGYNM